MKNRNAYFKITTLLLVSLISFSLLTISVNFGNDSFAHASPNAPPTTNSSTSPLVSTQNPAMKEVLSGNARLVEHKISNSELQDLKKLEGVSVEGQNYNNIVNGYGTGLKPPSEAEWNTLEYNLFVVDSVNNLNNNDGSPVRVDESSKSWFPPIGNQGSQGSCVTWSVGYYTKTFQEALEHGWDLSGASWQGGYSGYPTPSYQNRIASPAFIYNLINSGVDSGSSYNDAMNLVCFVGDSSWQTMPYIMTNCTVWPSEQAWTEAPLMRGDNSGFQLMYLTTDSALASLKSWISSDHLATIRVDANKFTNLTSYDLWTTDNYFPSFNHAGTIVGYDDSFAFTENGTTHYGAFKVANSWGVGGWEKVNDGFYWISYEAIKQRTQYCYFYNDLIGYNPTLEATFQIQHPKRSECDIQVGIGNPNSPISLKSFSQYIHGGALPFCQNKIVFDITEFRNSVSTIDGQKFFLRVLDGGTSSTGTITTFGVNQQNSKDAPCQTMDQKPVYLNLTFSESPKSLGLSSATGWYWTGNTVVNSVAVGDVNGDGQKEVVSGGYFNDGTRNVAQLIVWDSSSLVAEHIQCWYWTSNTVIKSVAIKDVDGDGQVEIVTGGYFNDGTRDVAQLIEWNGATLSVDRLTGWYWTGNTVINSVALGDVDSDGQVEVVTGGSFFDGSRNVAQLIEWNGVNLAVDRLTSWYWTGNTVINSVALGDVDGDGQVEIVTGGSFNDGSRAVAQLIEWNGTNLAVDRLTSWYWTSNTAISSVALGDVDNDGQVEVVTGGDFFDGSRNVAQLVEWKGASLAVDRLTSWYWTSDTYLNSVVLGDVDGDSQIEVVCGGYFNDGSRAVAQLIEWNGANLGVDRLTSWFWTNDTVIYSIAGGDVNSDGQVEVVTGGAFFDGTRANSQLTVWGMM